MILDHEGTVVDDPEESYTIKTLNNEVDALTTGLEILIKHRDNTVAKMYELRKENDALRAKWESIPWAAIEGCMIAADQEDSDYQGDGEIVGAWLAKYSPEPERTAVDAQHALLQSVPWAALHTAIWLMASYLPSSKEADYDALIAFVESNAPQEATE